MGKQRRALLHFTGFETAKLVITSGKLLVRPLGKASNDLREFKPAIPSIGFDGTNYVHELSDDNERLREAFLHFRTEHIYMKCFSRESPSVSWDSQASKIYSSTLWSHYGNQGDGVALVFDEEKLINAFEEASDVQQVLSCRVRYTKREWNRSTDPQIPWMENDAHLTERVLREFHVRHAVRTLFTKHDSWSYEDEFRIAIIGDCQTHDAGPFLDGIEVDIRKALTNIVLGSEVLKTRDVRQLVKLKKELPKGVAVAAMVNNNSSEGGEEIMFPHELAALLDAHQREKCAIREPISPYSSKPLYWECGFLDLVTEQVAALFTELSEWASNERFDYSSSQERVLAELDRNRRIFKARLAAPTGCMELRFFFQEHKEAGVAELLWDLNVRIFEEDSKDRKQAVCEIPTITSTPMNLMQDNNDGELPIFEMAASARDAIELTQERGELELMEFFERAAPKIANTFVGSLRRRPFVTTWVTQDDLDGLNEWAKNYTKILKQRKRELKKRYGL